MRKNATFDPPPIPINKIRRPPKWEVFPTVLSVWERFIRNQRGGLEKEGDIFSMFFSNFQKFAELARALTLTLKGLGCGTHLYPMGNEENGDAFFSIPFFV